MPAWAVLVLLPALACGPEESLSSRCAGVVYGKDSRKELFEIQQPALQQRAERSVVALVASRDLVPSDDGETTFIADTAGETYALCEGEPFAQQPAAAYCSGTLIAPDLVLTAGHCFRDETTCQYVSAVFGYHMQDDEALAPIPSDSVYHCEELVVFSPPDDAADRMTDYAIMRLDRPADLDRVAPISGEPPSPLRSYALMGHGLGLPLKVDQELSVRDPRLVEGDYFTASVDAFAGDSGAGVFDDRGALVGMLLSGQPDFQTTKDGCQVVRTEPGGCGQKGPAEHVSYLQDALADLCEADPDTCDLDPTRPAD